MMERAQAEVVQGEEAEEEIIGAVPVSALAVRMAFEHGKLWGAAGSKGTRAC